jgi:hypothetical protein
LRKECVAPSGLVWHFTALPKVGVDAAMSVLGKISRGLCWWAGAFVPLAAVAAAIELTTADISGDYEDGGTTLSSTPGMVEGEASLGALVRLVGDAKVAQVLHDQTAQVRFKREGGLLVIETFDYDGQVSWRGWWRDGEQFVQRGSTVIMRFQTAPDGEEVILLFEPVAGDRLLQVTVQRFQPTIFGPMVRQRGVFLFSRIP